MSTESEKASAAESPRRARNLAWLVAGAFFMELLDATVITPALPEMARSLGVRPVDLSPGVSAYLLTLAIFIPVSGWMADRFGARRVFGSALALFTLASALCGVSRSVEAFTVARILQGLGGAMMVPVGRLVVLRNTEKRDLVQAIATIVWPGLIAPVIGPPVGGFITSYWSWRWIFFLNVPLGLFALAMTIALVHDTAREQRPFDLWGFLLTAVGMGCLLYAVEILGRAPTFWTLSAFTIGAAAMLAATLHLQKTPHPLVDLSSIRIRTFATVLNGGSYFRIAIGSAPFLLPLLFQLELGMNAAGAGTLLLFLFAGNIAMKPATTWIMRRFGFRNVLLVNGVLVVMGFVACASFGPRSSLAWMAAVLFASGLCRSMQFTAMNTMGFSEVPPAQMSGASTLFSVFQQMNAGLGIAFGALALHAAQWVRGRLGAPLEIADFRIAFLSAAALALLALVDVIPLPRDAGAEVSGHRRAAG